MLIPNCKKCLFEGATLNFYQKLRKFVMAAQIENLPWNGGILTNFMGDLRLLLNPG
jgi:hypothetical protein